MGARTPGEHLVAQLEDIHSMEEQALLQMRDAPRIAGDPELAAMFRDHASETEGHERRVRERLEAHGGGPGRARDAAMRAGGAGFMLFARSQPDTPGKLLAHAHSYEALELAAYGLLESLAGRVGDEETVRAAREIGDEERAMRDRVAGAVDRAAQASLSAAGDRPVREELVAHLADAHALEAQSIELLTRAPSLAGDPVVARILERHRHESEEQRRLLRERLDALGAPPSALKDAAMRLGAVGWTAFFAVQPDTPGKLAAFAYAVEHLEIAGQELLLRVALAADDPETVDVVERIVAEERAAADALAESLDRAATASLEAVGAGG